MKDIEFYAYFNKNSKCDMLIKWFEILHNKNVINNYEALLVLISLYKRNTYMFEHLLNSDKTTTCEKYFIFMIVSLCRIDNILSELVNILKKSSKFKNKNWGTGGDKDEENLLGDIRAKFIAHSLNKSEKDNYYVDVYYEYNIPNTICKCIMGDDYIVPDYNFKYKSFKDCKLHIDGVNKDELKQIYNKLKYRFKSLYNNVKDACSLDISDNTLDNIENYSNNCFWVNIAPNDKRAKFLRVVCNFKFMNNEFNNIGYRFSSNIIHISRDSDLYKYLIGHKLFKTDLIRKIGESFELEEVIIEIIDTESCYIIIHIVGENTIKCIFDEKEEKILEVINNDYK